MNYYDVSPRIVPAGRVSEIRIRPRYRHALFPEKEQMNVVCNPFDGLMPDGSYNEFSWDSSNGPQTEWFFEGDTLIVRYEFAGEQEHNLRVIIRDKKNPDSISVKAFRIYSLNPDLYALRPLRGDFHIHTTGYDGLEHASYVVARYRQKGFDFAAVTDHGNYKPSVEAIEYWKPLDLDFRLYPGEEVHAKDNPVHIINFGGKRSVNDMWRDNTVQYEKEVTEILKSIPEKTAHVNFFAVASSEWVFRKIREVGGLSVFCHPYWSVTQNVIDEGITSEIFRRRKFDAFEVLGGSFRNQTETNNYQVVRYYEEMAKGNHFPVVGVSDSHGTDHFDFSGGIINSHIGMKYVDSKDADLFGWYFTVVLAKENTAEAIIDGIRNYRSCAVSQIAGETLRVYGSFRLTKYVNFLLREYFPLHDNLCAEEGALMLDYLAGDSKAGEALKLLKGRTLQYQEESFRNAAVK